MTAEVVTLNGAPLAVAEPTSEAGALVSYFRGVADMIENGAIDPTHTVVILSGGATLTVQHIGLDRVQAVGVIAYAQKALLEAR